MGKVYQCQELKWLSEAQQYYTRHCEEFCEDVNNCLRSRMEWSDQQVIRDIISVLATQGWEKKPWRRTYRWKVSIKGSLTVPLQGEQANCDKIKEKMVSLLQ